MRIALHNGALKFRTHGVTAGAYASFHFLGLGLQCIVTQTANDELWMEEALRAAQRALEIGEIPVGAVVVCGGKIVGRGWNRNITDSDPSGHAEILALREAGTNLGNHRLSECELFVTIEPCAMCAGALVHARIKRLIYGADDPKAGAVRSVLQVLNHPQLNHQMEVRSGVLAGRSGDLLQVFFRSRR
jgi:tRNA(adenine34) deaminase